MKLNFSRCALSLMFFVSGILFSCSEQPPVCGTTPPDGEGFSLSEIKRTFASDYAAATLTRADGELDETEILAPGRITPLWDSVSLYYSGHLFQASVLFSTPCGYRLLRQDEDGDLLLSPMPSCLVVLKDADTDETASYLRFFIRDANPASDGGTGFYGLVLHTTLSGLPVSVGKYSCGVLSDWASLFDETRTWEENVDRMFGFLQDVCVARVREGVATRAIDIPAVTIDAWAALLALAERMKMINDLNSMGPDLPGLEPPGDLPDFGGGGGGGGGGSSSGDESNPLAPDSRPYPYNPRISADKAATMVLDSINLDCMGQLLINAIGNTVRIESGYFGVGSKTVSHATDYGYGAPPVISYEVKIGSRCDPISVTEELIHIYQGLGTADFQRAALNNEVEAKLGWYMYWERNGRKNNVDGALGNWENRKYFDRMSELFLQNDLQNPEFAEAFENAAEGLRVLTYGDQNRYLFDPGQTGCKKLVELMKDCINK